MKGYTIQHSIDLLEKKVEAGGSGGGSTAADITYDNTSSGLTADDVQDAIDELNTAIGLIDTDVHYSKTERKIGTWHDGSDLYQITITTTRDSIAANASIDVTSDLPAGLDKVVDYENIMTYTASSITTSYINSNFNNFKKQGSAWSITLAIGSTTLTDLTIDWTIRYTKTAPASNTRKKSSK